MIWLGLLLFLAACQGDADIEAAEPETDAAQNTVSTQLVADPSQYDDFEIISVLPKDAIPAIFEPEFFTIAEANGIYTEEELVMGVAFDGQARAYSVPYLSRHEIVNDEVAGVKIAVTW